MRKTYLKLASAAAVLAMAMGSQAAMAQTSDTIDATATVITPLAVAAGDNLRFGTIGVGTTASTIEVTTAGVATVATGGNAVLYTGAGRGSFDVSGQDTLLYDVDVTGTPDAAATADGIVLTAVTAACAGGTAGGTALAPTLIECTTYGSNVVTIGGTLAVADDATVNTAEVTVGVIEAIVSYN